MKKRVQILWFFIMAGVLFFVTVASALPPGVKEKIPKVGDDIQKNTQILKYPGPLMTVKATLSPEPLSYSGNCPARITFKGKITLSSALQLTKPVEVKYRFKRSDGAVDANVKTLIFHNAGSQDVIDFWDLGGSSLPTYCGWESIEIISPQSVESTQAPFALLCSNVPLPDLKITDIFAIPQGSGQCNVGFKIKNMGGAIGTGNCINNALVGIACNGSNCMSIQVPVGNNIQNSGGEDTYTGYWPNPLLDFSKSFSVKLSFRRVVSTFPTPSTQSGNEFSMAKILKCL